MDQRERLLQAFDLQRPDRPPILGGWLSAPAHIQTLTGCTEDAYWSDPFHWGLEAEKCLGSDGVITVFVPVERGEYRCVDGQVLAERAAFTLEGIRDWIDTLPDADDVADNFALADMKIHPHEPMDFTTPINEDTAYARFSAEQRDQQAHSGAMVWCPADWSIIPKALWYHEFGYENALMLPFVYPDAWQRLFRLSAAKARQRAALRARATREGILPPAFLTGEDLCDQRGPMVSPKWLHEHYFPVIEEVFAPLRAAGVRVVWHCDGDYRRLLDDVLACGVGGLQGFQKECGMDIEWIVERRTRDGDPLLIFGPMSVTQTLPYGTPDDVRASVAHAMRVCRDKASLVFFTSNTITPDVPLDNITAFWDAVHSSSWDTV